MSGALSLRGDRGEEEEDKWPKLARVNKSGPTGQRGERLSLRSSLERGLTPGSDAGVLS